MKPLNWVELARQQIKAKHGFGWSISGWVSVSRLLRILPVKSSQMSLYLPIKN